MELSQIEELAVLLHEHPISEIEVNRDGSRIHLRKGAVAAIAAAPSAVAPHETPAAVAEAPTEAQAPTDMSIILSSEMVGHFHHATPPIRVGSTIKEGQVVGNVESMKLMNEVVAGSAGQVVEVLIEDGEPVDYGRQLFRIVPSK